MSVEENKALVRRWVDLWNTGNLDAVGEALETKGKEKQQNAQYVCVC